jgi:hypothetical protein
MTGVAWGSAYADGVGPTIRTALFFVLGHFLGTSLLVSTLMYFLVGRVLGKRRQGLFGPSATGTGEEGLEFGYCFDVGLPIFILTGNLANSNTQVSIRAFLPLWVFLYVLQFLFMPLIARDYWVSNFFGNTMYLLALSYYFVITFLGYNGKRQIRWCLSIVVSLTNHSSPTFPEPNRSSFGTRASPCHHLGYQLVHLRLRDESRASAMVWCEPEKGSLNLRMKRARKLPVHNRRQEPTKYIQNIANP